MTSLPRNHSFKIDLSQYDNLWYNPRGNIIQRTLWYYINALFFICPLNPFSCLKVWLLRLFGAKVGKGVIIKPSVNIKYPWKLKIGDFSWIGEKVWIDNLADVTIGSNVCISQGAMLLCGNHNYKTNTFDLIVKPIVIKDGAWVGAKCIVCPGVIIGECSVISVGITLRQSTRPYTVYKKYQNLSVKPRC